MQVPNPLTGHESQPILASLLSCFVAKDMERFAGKQRSASDVRADLQTQKCSGGMAFAKAGNVTASRFCVSVGR